jgi:uncharacterized protein
MPLLVETYLKETPDKGLGLFAKQFVPKGTSIYTDDYSFDRTFTNAQVEKMSALMQAHVHKYATYQKAKDEWYLCADNARFWNHSEHPNTDWDDDKSMMAANRDIQAGEELTCNYRQFCDVCKEGNFGFEIK